MTAKDLRALIFDLDDTLYPEAAFVESGFGAVAAWAASQWSHVANEIATELKQLFDRGVRGNTFEVWLKSNDLFSAAAESEMVHVYRTHSPRITPFAESIEVLQQCQQKYPLALVSDGLLSVQRNKFNALALQPYFEVVVFSDELGREFWKPSPVPFETALQRLGVAAESSIYIADNVHKDFWGPRELGMGTIQVRRPGGLYANAVAPSERHQPHLIVGDLREAISRLQEFPRD